MQSSAYSSGLEFPLCVLYVKKVCGKNKTGKSKLGAPSVCGCATQATKKKSPDPSTENPVYPEMYLEPHQIAKT